MKIVSICHGRHHTNVWSDEWIDAIGKLGAFTFIELDGPMSDDEAADVYRAHDVAIVGWTERQIPEALAADAGALRYVLSYSGSIRNTVPRSIVEAGIIVSNWGDLPAAGVAEGAMTLLLALAHQLPTAVRTQHDGGWGVDGGLLTRLEDLAVGVYGCGVIGARFVEMLRPFGARVRVYDPYAPELPDGVEPCNSLGELCAWSEALVIHAGLSDETEHSLGTAELAQLRDGAIVVNTARGAIVDQDALWVELLSGRLRAGLDVLEPDMLAPDHPIRALDNVLLTYHAVSLGDWPPRPGLSKAQLRVLEQLERFARGEMPQWTFDLERYDRST